MIHSKLFVRFLILAGICLACQAPLLILAEEPASRFIERLREERLFDLASKYLDIYGKQGWLPKSALRDAPLERLMIIEDSLAASRTSSERDSRLASLEGGYRDFLETAKDHPRRAEAGLRFGSLTLERGRRELQKLDDPNQKGNVESIRQAARTAFMESEAVFKKTQADLTPRITEMAGAKIASKDTEKIELRKRYQAEYRQAEILQGLALKLIATTYPSDAAPYQEWLKKAEDKLSDIIKKASPPSEIGAKTLSRLYRGDVQTLQGKVDAAIESYTPVADIEEDGPFRLWRAQATAAIVRLMGSPAGGDKYDEALKRGVELLKKMGKNEQMLPEWNDLQLAISQARIGYSNYLKKNKGSDTATKAELREAREMLTLIARRPGEHQNKAKKLLSELGVNAAQPIDSKLPSVKSFDEAFKEAKIRLERAAGSQLSIEILQSRLKETTGADATAIEAEIQATLDNASRDRDQALQLLSKALRLYAPSDTREDLLIARSYIAYLLLLQERYWEATAVSDFVARSGPGTDSGLKACTFALIGFGKVMESLPEDRQLSLIGSLESLAQYMIATWPEAEETQQATLTLLQYALKSKQWDEAERILTLMPTKGDQTNATRRDLGYVLWIQYLMSVDAERKAGNDKAIGDVELRDRAERLLTDGWQALETVHLDQRAVEAAAALAALYLRTDRREKAEAILEREKIGPVAVIANRAGPVKDASVRLEVLRLKLQAKVMAAGTGSASLDPAEVESLVQAMQQAAVNDSKLLTSTLLMLARDLQDQLKQAEKVSDKSKLAGGIQVLLTQLADVSKDAGILDWAGTTMFQLASGLSSNAGTADADIARKLNGAAIQVFQKMLDTAEKDPVYLEAIQRKADDILLKQAMAYRGQSEYQKAADSFLKILKGNASQLTAQIEAARNYQQWSAAKDPDLLKKAMFGAEPDQRQKNIVWGWGNISKMLSSQMGNRPELQKIFFEARLQLATCRRLLGKTQPAAEQKKLLEQAVSDIRQTYLAYPELGGPESKSSFDKLLRLLQADLNRAVVGLKEFDQPNAGPK